MTRVRHGGRVRPERKADLALTVGVCYASAQPSDDVETLVVRMVMTLDTTSAEKTTRYATGPDAASKVLREWMAEMCASGGGGT